MKRQFSIKWKAVSGNLIILVIILTALCILISTYTMNICRDLVKINLSEMSHRYANAIKGDWERSFEVSSTLGTSVETLWKSGIHDRDIVNSMLDAVIKKNPGLVGTGTAWEADAFDGRDEVFKDSGDYGGLGRYSSWYYRDGGSILSEAWVDGYEVEDYYRIPKETKAPHITDPYWYETGTGRLLLVTISIPVMDGSDFKGIVTVDVDMTSYVAMMQNVRPYGVGDAAIFKDNGIIVSHIDENRIGKHMRETEADVVGDNIGPMIEATEKGELFTFIVKLGGREGSVLGQLTPFKIGNIQTNFTFASAVPLNIALQEVYGLIIIVIISFVITLIIIGLFTYILMNIITKPVVVISGFLGENLTTGDLRSELDESVTSKNDEIGVAASSTNALIFKLRDVITNIQSAAEQVVSGSGEISSSSQRISTGASEQASSIEELTSSMEELSATISQNSDNSNIADTKASQVTSEAEASGKAANEAAKLINTIAEKISIISEFSRNTNMLALNAAIEAARAGEEGKGFAVVAQEIRKLAVNSQAAASEIVEIASSGVKAVENVRDTIESIIPELKDTAQLIQEITAASHEQAQGSEQMNSALQQMNTIVQENASVSEELASMAEELNAQAEGMSTAVRFFKLKDGPVQSFENRRQESQSQHQSYSAPPSAAKINEQLMIEDRDFEEF